MPLRGSMERGGGSVAVSVQPLGALPPVAVSRESTPSLSSDSRTGESSLEAAGRQRAARRTRQLESKRGERYRARRASHLARSRHGKLDSITSFENHWEISYEISYEIRRDINYEISIKSRYES